MTDSQTKIHDITLAISPSMVIWPGHPTPEVTRRSDMRKGDRSNNSSLAFTAHTGTHVDAPAHFVKDGGLVDALDLELLVGEVLVVDAGDASELSEEVLKELDIPPGTKRVLFRTRNSVGWQNNETEFTEDYVGITTTGAEWLVARGVRLVGTDYLSVAKHSENVTAHQVLLSAGLILVETLNLYHITPGSYELICLPLKIAGAEAAPARVVLIDRAGWPGGR